MQTDFQFMTVVESELKLRRDYCMGLWYDSYKEIVSCWIYIFKRALGHWVLYVICVICIK
jgi:hypothetical protein